MRKMASFVLVILSFIFVAAANALPIITNEELTTLTDTTAIITWVTTNESTTSEVYYGISSASTLFTTDESKTTTHYAALSGLNPGTTYRYYVKSGAATGTTKAFTTLTPPSGQYLFTFATLSDPQYGVGKADTFGARGRPYSSSEAILLATVSSINQLSPAFTILKGDLIESSIDSGDMPYGDYVNTTVMPTSVNTIKTALNGLTKASDITYKYFPIPGNHDKTAASYTGGNASSWYNNNLSPLYAGKTVGDPTANSCFNYSFDYQGYRFIMLDSVRSTTLVAEINTTFLSQEVTSAESIGLKSFIFTHHPVTDLRDEGIPIEIIKEVAGGTEDYTQIQVINSAEVQAIITQYKDSIAGIFSGHIHDNNYKTVSGVPYVRTASGLQFPTGFNIYKVYTNGFIQSFYKVPLHSEYARSVVTSEVAGYSDNYWEQFGLGPNNARNFSRTLSAIKPFVSSITPASGASAVPINENIIIKFTKAMSTPETEAAITITPAPTAKSFSWPTADTLVIAHSNLSASILYTITIGAGAIDSGGLAISAYSISFTTSAVSDTTHPQAKFDHFALNMTSNNLPTFTGIATDELSTITSIECRIDGGAWVSATPLDQQFNSTQETFTFTPTAALVRRATEHTIEARCSDSAQNTNTTFESYSFYVVGDSPEISLKANGLDIVSGDPIEQIATFEVRVVSNNGLTLNALLASVDNGSQSTLAKTVDPANTGIVTSTYSPTLSDGVHSIRVSIADDLGNLTTREVAGLVVQSTAEAVVQGVPLGYPNPYNGTGNVTLGYTLTKSLNITLTIHDLLGNQIVKKSISSSQAGGKAGYNEVTWDGKTDSGQSLGNGIYTYLVIGEGRVLGKGKLAVARQ